MTDVLGVPEMAGAELFLDDRDARASAVLMTEDAVKATNNIAAMFLIRGMSGLCKTRRGSVSCMARLRDLMANVRLVGGLLKMSRRRDVSDQQHQIKPDRAWKIRDENAD